MTSTINLNIQISDEAAKAIMVTAVVLGMAYVVYKVIENMDENLIPLPQEAREFSRLPEVTPTSFDQIVGHAEVRQRTLQLFRDGHYVSAVREAAVALFDIVRRKSGVKEDGTTLVQRAFRGSARVLQFVNIAPAHVTNADDGLIGHLESFAKHTRKIQMHSSVELTEQEALIQINLACYLADHVERNAVPAANTCEPALV